jgi:hypothetical protein
MRRDDATVGFEDAVRRTSGLDHAYQTGLQAVSHRDRGRMECQRPSDLVGSVHLDRALQKSHPNDPRWDYGIGLRRPSGREVALWVEVHPATAHGVKEVCAKHAWLRNWLSSSAPLLDAITDSYLWIASGKVDIPPDAPQRRRLASQGIRLVGRKLQL